MPCSYVCDRPASQPELYEFDLISPIILGPADVQRHRLRKLIVHLLISILAAWDVHGDAPQASINVASITACHRLETNLSRGSRQKACPLAGACTRARSSRPGC